MPSNLKSHVPNSTRFSWVILGGLLLALIATGGSLVTGSAQSSRAATPAGGRLTDTVRNLNWRGPDYSTGKVVPDPALCSAPGNCDDYELYVQLPAGYTNTQQISVTVTITWPNAGDDYDLYVLTPEGATAASSATGGGTSEQATLICPRTNVTYTVRTVPFLIAPSVTSNAYTGRAQLNVSTGTGCNPNVPQAPPPFRDTGGLVFGPSTNVDPQRQVGEPDIVFAPNGDIYASGPWGTATQQSFAWKSMDGGLTYNTIGRIRPDVGPGGGDTSTEVDDQNFVYLTDLEGLVNTAAARSTDGGQTFTRNSIASYLVAVDRQWMALDNGPTSGAGDNTQFYTYRQVGIGSFVGSSTDGQTFIPAQANPATPMSTGAPCGDFIFDPVDRYLYLPCGRADKVDVARAFVAPNQRTGLVFTSTLAGDANGDASEIFPTLDTDGAGDVYVGYVDTADHNIYYVYSTNNGRTWSAPVRLNGNEARTVVFPWIDAGAPGRMAMAYIATDQRGPNNNGDPNDFPSWFNDKPGSTTVKWHLYVNYVLNANTPNPTIYQVRVTEHPMNYGQICTAGTLCAATGGDRTMADFLTLQHDNTGALSIIFNDTTNQHHGASVMEVRQLAGPSIFGANLAGTQPTNPVTDMVRDAQYPHFSPTGPGPNFDALDIKGVGILQDSANVTVTMTISNLNASRVLPGASSVLYLTNWRQKALGDYGEESYRIYYAGAKSTGGGPPTFFYGTTNAAEGSQVGCTQTTPQTCKLLQYPSTPPLANTTTGTFNAATGEIRITVPRSGIMNPPAGTVLHSVTGYTLGTRDTSPDFYDDVDVAKAFTVTLQGGPGPTVTAPVPSATVPVPSVTATAPVPTLAPSVTPGGPTVTTAPTFTVAPTSTPGGPTVTTAPTNTPGGPTNTATRTAVIPTAATTGTPTVCTLQFSDVPNTNDFYPFVRCLACRGILGGYSDGTFRPNNEVTRGQISKIVANSALFNEPPTGQTYQDVPTDSTFYPFIEKMSARGVMGGYPCGQRPSEPCGASGKPYFRPNANATRGQISKIVANAAGYVEPATGQTFEDVPTTNPFYSEIQRLASRNIMGGYPCGGTGEPCGSGSKPYFRWSNTTTRGQASKIVANTFFPSCQMP